MNNRQWVISGVVMAAMWAGACSLTTDLNITGGETASGGTGGTLIAGGAGGEAAGPATCTSVTECPPASSFCESPVCLGGLCGTVATQSGVELPDGQQVVGNCLLSVCDGSGAAIEQNDDTDVLTDTECTAYECLSGVLQTSHFDLGTDCTDGLCDGEGLCAECLTASDCVELPESDECGRRACNNHLCEMQHTADGTALDAQSSGDCKLRVCDGQGGQRDDPLVTDLPDDSNDCTWDQCNGATPDHPYKNPDTVCAAGYCNAIGQCVGCTAAAQCGEDTECLSWTCTAGQVCEIDYVDAGTAVNSGQTAGDCQLIVCDGNGAEITQEDAADLPPDDGYECTGETCVNGSPQHPDEPLDEHCDQGGGSYCDGEGACVECNNPTHCGYSTECMLRVCEAHACGTDYAVWGTPVSQQTDRDCQLNVCDGQGGTTTIDQNTDLPIDGDPCTDDVCTAGVPTNPFTDPGVSCGGGDVCDGNGNCVDCVADGHCLSTQYCGLDECLPDVPQGADCNRPEMCTTDWCIDGYCCESQCKLHCMACAASKTGSGNGTCADVTDLTDPDNECEGASVCLASGLCCYENSYDDPGPQPQAGEIFYTDCP